MLEMFKKIDVFFISVCGAELEIYSDMWTSQQAWEEEGVIKNTWLKAVLATLFLK